MEIMVLLVEKGGNMNGRELKPSAEEGCFISVKGRNCYDHYKVPEAVYIYIKQLEAYINNPFKSGLLELYPERFDKKGEI